MVRITGDLLYSITSKCLITLKGMTYNPYHSFPRILLQSSPRFERARDVSQPVITMSRLIIMAYKTKGNPC